MSLREEPDPARAPEGDAADELVEACIAVLESDGPEALARLLEEHPEAAPRARARLRELHLAGLLDDSGEPGHPERMGDFRLLEPLGSGGMGVVFLAVQESLGREVALKLIRPERLYFPGARERFRREVEVVARLQHPGLVPVFTVGEEGGLPYFAMERVRGASLASVLAELAGRRPEELVTRDLAQALERASGEAVELGDRGETPWVETVVGLVLQVARTLAHTHAEGVLHRDVKPSNLMLALDLRVLLTDFGLASSESTDSITGSGTVLGSMPYLPPEHLRGEEVGEESDVYSLGATMYELLALRQPFRERDPEALRSSILRGDERDVRELNPAVSWDLATVCATAMELDPARRYPDADAFVRDLENLLALRPIEARRPGFLLRTRRWTQRRPAAAVAIAMLLVGSILGLFAYLSIRAEAEGEVRASWERAEANLDLALESIDEMLARVGDAQLSAAPVAQTIRLGMVEEAERLLTEMRVQRPHSEDLELRQARLAVARVDTLVVLGRGVEGEADLQAGIAALERHAERRPDDVDLRLRIVRGWSSLGNLRLALGRGEEATAAFESGIASCLSLTDAHAAAADAWLASSAMHRNYGRLLHDLGRREQAISALHAAADAARSAPAPADEPGVTVERSLALSRALSLEADILAERGDPRAAELHAEASEVLEVGLALRPDDPQLLVHAIEIDSNRGAFASRVGRKDDAGPLFDSALARARRIVELFPDVVSYRVWLGRVQANRAAHAAEGGDIMAGRERIEDAITVFEELHAALPDVTEFTHGLAGALMNAAAMHFFPDTVDLARDYAERAIETAEVGLEDAPDHPDLESVLGQALLTLANTQQHAGSYRDAEASIRAAAETSLADVDWMRMTGELWVDCANLAAGDPALDRAGREELHERYLDEALGAFELAFQRGYRDADYLAGNPHLARLREREEFQGLLEEMRSTP